MGITIRQQVNNCYKELFTNNSARYFILMGGRGAGRSTVGGQYALARLVSDEYFRCAIMRLVLGDIRNSIFQDISDRIDETGLNNTISIKQNTLTFEYGKNKINGIGFRRSSGDQKSKLKSLANYNVIIIEEADEISEEDFMQLDDSIRTVNSNVKIILLLNPPNKNHWIVKRWFNLVKSPVDGFYIPKLKESAKQNTVFIHTSYLDNIRNIAPSSIHNYNEYKKTNPAHYYNMIRGYVSDGLRGRIFTNWIPISLKEYESLDLDPFYGLDFGFTNDPTGLIEIKKHNNKVYFHELLYEKGLVNHDPTRRVQSITQRLEENGIKKGAFIYADSAEPKSIKEIAMDGWNIIGNPKSPDSVRSGINRLHQLEIYYVETDANLILEYENYKWGLNRNKEPTNTPIDAFNHLIDGGRYGITGHESQGFLGFA